MNNRSTILNRLRLSKAKSRLCVGVSCLESSVFFPTTVTTEIAQLPLDINKLPHSRYTRF